MSYPYHHSTGEPDQHGNSPGGSFYGGQAPYQYQQPREEYFDMNTEYGHQDYNTVANENDDTVANTGNVFPVDMNQNNNNTTDIDSGFPHGTKYNNDNAQDTKENVTDTGEGNANNGFASVLDILSQLNDSDIIPAQSDGEPPAIPHNSSGEPPAIPPNSSGEGLPFAPENWPNPGDNWSWKVGKRVKGTGYYSDRFLQLPKSLISFTTPKQPFGSKPAVERYIVENFPGADIDAFFASFHWMIRSTEDPKTRGPSSAQGATEGTGTQGNEETPTTQGRIKRKAAVKAAANIAAPAYSQVETDRTGTEGTISPASKRAKRKTAGDVPSASPKQRSSGRQIQKKAVADSSETPKQKATPKRRTRQQQATPTDAVQPQEEEPPIDPVEFDKYLSSLDDIIALPPTSVDVVEEQSVPNAQTYAAEQEIAKARTKLTTLLDMDFPSLFRSKKLTELTSLAFKVRKDPRLSAEQLVKLKLVEEIPTYSEVYLENRAIADQADNFFDSLEANKAKIANLKNEYGGLKEQAIHLQTEVNISKSAVKEINEQIAMLQSQRNRLTATIKDKNKKKSDLNNGQNSIAHSIPKVVQEIQIANSKKFEWELKKENAAKREAEILERFVPLRGFCL
jgi:uncharacterized small protein (DUF1192 family)